MEQASAITNNSISAKDKVAEKNECVPFVWIFIVSELINKYIKEELTNADGIVDEKAMEAEIYPFYVKISSTDHPHLQIEDDTLRQVYEKVYYKGADGGRSFLFKDDKVGVYSLLALKSFYFNKDVTLRLKNRLINEVDTKTSDSLKQFKASRQINLLSNEETVILNNMYVESVFKIEWAGSDNPPKWYYPCPKTAVEIEKAIKVAIRIIDSKKVNVVRNQVIDKKIKISNVFKGKV